MNYLLDTHVFLWFIGDPKQLSSRAVSAIREPRNVINVSAVTSVEISIKKALGKLEAPADLRDEIAFRSFVELPLKFEHGAVLYDLPPFHQDPFDRMLIAQAKCEGLTIITRDNKFEVYPVEVLPA